MENDIRREVIDLFVQNESDRACDLILKNKPEFLYKYRSGALRDIEALKKGKLWIARATEMDDDEEGRVFLKSIFKSAVKDMAEADEKYKDPKYEYIVDNIDEITRKETFICSLSEIYTNEDMWNRYANESKGFCIEYKFDEIFCFNKNGLRCLPVTYGTKKPLGPKDFKDVNALVFSALYRKNEIGNKGEDWNGQREWRIACFEKTLGELEKPNGTSIEVPVPSRIILGKNASDDLQKQLTDAIADMKASIELKILE